VFYRNTPVNSITYSGSNPYSPANPEYTTSQTHSIERLGGEFGQLNWQFTNTLQLQVGARENWDSNYGTGDSETYNPLTNAYSISGSANGTSCRPQGFTQYGCISRTYTDSVPTGKVDLNWSPVQGQFLYVFAARGYQAGGINSDNTTFEPEHVNDYELGWKGTLADNHIQMQVGGYWMVFQNYQYSLTNPVSGISDVINLPTATIKGIEASMQAHLAQWDFDAGIYYNKTALGAFTAVQAYKVPTTVPTNTPGCPAGEATPANYSCFNYAPYEVTLSGSENAFSPPLTANADVGYRFMLGGGVLEPRVTYSHTDKQYGSIFQEDSYYEMAARNLWGADIVYTAGPWMADLYGTNLANKKYISGYYGAGGNLNDVFYGAPRQYGARLSYTF
jgi:iron complex outermembrane receptor protein